MAFLNKQAADAEATKKVNKRKALLDEIGELRTKRMKLQKDIDGLSTSADALAYEAERTGQFRELLIKSNALRSKKNAKVVELDSLDKCIKLKEGGL